VPDNKYKALNSKSSTAKKRKKSQKWVLFLPTIKIRKRKIREVNHKARI
jgi:hypothetical protein